jgi:hypothetical protein
MTTALQIAEKALQLADQHPDFVYFPPKTDDPDYNPYGDCMYVHEGKGSCLFGQAILELGAVDVDYLDEHKDARIGTLIKQMERDGLMESSPEGLLSAMTRAQMDQDVFKPWADAVASLREYVGSLAA